MREIKFRAWDNINKQMSRPLTLNDIGRIENRESWFDLFIGYEWDKLIWLEYTGLKDKNGKEVYGGDIIKLHDFRPTAVKWYRQGFIPIIYENCEIIGNIYENPELLPSPPEGGDK